MTTGELTPGSVIDACMKEEMQINAIYAKKTGMAGDTCFEKYGPLQERSVNKTTEVGVCCSREYEEENSWNDDDESTDHVNRPIPSVLQSTTEPEYSVPSKVLIIDAWFRFRDLLRFWKCLRSRGRKSLVALGFAPGRSPIGSQEI